MAAKRGLTLTRLGPAPIDYQFVGAYRLRITASNPRGGMDQAVFLWREDPYNVVTGETLNTVLNVCSPSDMAEYPEGAPVAGTPYPFFRRDYLEVDVRALSQASVAWDRIVALVGRLCRLLDLFDSLVEVDSAECGAPPPGDSASLSASTSTSTSG